MRDSLIAVLFYMVGAIGAALNAALYAADGQPLRLGIAVFLGLLCVAAAGE